MAIREQTARDRAKKRREAQEVVDAPQTDEAKRAEAEKRTAEIDAMLDDIDGVLEENAEEFVAAYVQKGGQ